MSVQYRGPVAPKVGFDLFGQNIGFPTALSAEELQRKVEEAKRYKASQTFTVDLSLNHIEPDRLSPLLTLLDELPKLRLDLSANDFDWNDLKGIIQEGFNPRGYRWLKTGRLTIASNLLMQQTEVSLASAAESIDNVGKRLDKLAEQTARNQSELYNLSFGLETEAAAAMQQYLESREPPGSVRADPSLLHIIRDTAHNAADTSKRPATEFSFDAAFDVRKLGTEGVWVGELKTKLIRDDVVTAHTKMLELRDYIVGAGGESQESEPFQRQAAQLKFLQGRPIKLFAGGARIMPDAMGKMDELGCTKLVPGAGRFTVHEPSPQPSSG